MAAELESIMLEGMVQQGKIRVGLYYTDGTRRNFTLDVSENEQAKVGVKVMFGEMYAWIDKAHKIQTMTEELKRAGTDREKMEIMLRFMESDLSRLIPPPPEG